MFGTVANICVIGGHVTSLSAVITSGFSVVVFWLCRFDLS
jgi:hypothetical protein